MVTEKADSSSASIGSSLLPEAVGARDSGYCEQSAPIVELSRAKAIPSQPATSISLPLPPIRRRYEAISIDAAVANEAFKGFRAQQTEQFENVSVFECHQRTALSAHHASSLRRLVVQQEAIRDEKMEQVRSRDNLPIYMS